MTGKNENRKTLGIYGSEEWKVWQQNASPFLLCLTLNAGMKNLKKFIGSPLWTSVIIFEDNQGKWLFRPKELKMLGQKMIDFLMCPIYRVAFMTGYDLTEKQLIKKAKEIQFNEKLETFTNDELMDLFDNYCQIYYDWYKFGWFCEPIQFQAQDILNSFFENSMKKKFSDISINDMKQAIFTIEEDSFAIVILKDLLECAKALEIVLKNKEMFKRIQAIRNDGNFPKQAANIVISTFKNEGKGNTDLKVFMEKVIGHSNKFYWKRNNYFSTQYLTEEDILIELFSSDKFDISNPIAQPQKELQGIRESKEKILKIKRMLLDVMPPFERNLAVISSSVGGSLIDRRKKIIMIANAAFDRILQEAGKRTKNELSNCRLLIPQELRYFLTSPREYGERFVERQKRFLVYQGEFPILDEVIGDLNQKSMDSSLNFIVFEMNDPFIAEGEYADKIIMELNVRYNYMVTDNTGLSEKIQGVAIYYDKEQSVLHGVVRIIKDPKSEKLESGEILIAPSTTPDYMDAIRKCKAIITDWGGQTSHAAIISRELKKPCIIGTNFASQVFRTGDKIKIDFIKCTIEKDEQK